jgi:hypothetical protein
MKLGIFTQDQVTNGLKKLKSEIDSDGSNSVDRREFNKFNAGGSLFVKFARLYNKEDDYKNVGKPASAAAKAGPKPSASKAAKKKPAKSKPAAAVYEPEDTLDLDMTPWTDRVLFDAAKATFPLDPKKKKSSYSHTTAVKDAAALHKPEGNCTLFPGVRMSFSVGKNIITKSGGTFIVYCDTSSFGSTTHGWVMTSYGLQFQNEMVFPGDDGKKLLGKAACIPWEGVGNAFESKTYCLFEMYGKLWVSLTTETGNTYVILQRDEPYWRRGGIFYLAQTFVNANLRC